MKKIGFKGKDKNWRLEAEDRRYKRNIRFQGVESFFPILHHSITPVFLKVNPKSSI